MNWNQASRKCREATLVRADGVAKSLGLQSFAELTTPSAALRRLRAFLLMPQPPLLFKEGNVCALKQSVNSFTRSDARGYMPPDTGFSRYLLGGLSGTADCAAEDCLLSGSAMP